MRNLFVLEAHRSYLRLGLMGVLACVFAVLLFGLPSVRHLAVLVGKWAALAILLYVAYVVVLLLVPTGLQPLQRYRMTPEQEEQEDVAAPEVPIDSADNSVASTHNSAGECEHGISSAQSCPACVFLRSSYR